jgi:hypothetical protein
MNHIDTRTSPPCLDQPNYGTVVSQKEAESQSAVPVSPVSQRQVELSREYQKEVNRATTRAEKISLLLGAVTECKNQVLKGNILGGLKWWVHRAGKVACCVTECHSGNIVLHHERVCSHASFSTKEERNAAANCFTALSAII